MKVVLNLKPQATAGSVYSEPDMNAVEQLLPSDEELAQRESERAEKERKEQAEEAEKKAKEKKEEKTEDGPKDEPGMGPEEDEEESDDEDSDDSEGDDDSDEDDSDEDSEEESDDDDSEDDEEATAADSFVDAEVQPDSSIQTKTEVEAEQKKPEDMTPEELQAHLDKEKEELEKLAPSPDAQAEKADDQNAGPDSDDPRNKSAAAPASQETPVKKHSKAIASALEAMASDIRPSSYFSLHDE